MRDTAERLADEPRLLALVKLLRERLPGDERFGDPLSTGGDDAVAYLARGVTALSAERGSVFGELGLTGLQVWQSLSERVGRGRGDMDLAVLCTDLVDFSSFALRAGDVAAIEMLGAVGTVIEDAVTVRRRGRVVKRLGDGMIATFLHAREAVDAALEIQEQIAGIEVENRQPKLRAAVHWGRPRRLGGEYLGVDVAIALSICEESRAGQVLVSDAAIVELERERLWHAAHPESPGHARTDGATGGAGGAPPDDLRFGRRRRLKAAGMPPELRAATVRRAD